MLTELICLTDFMSVLPGYLTVLLENGYPPFLYFILKVSKH